MSDLLGFAPSIIDVAYKIIFSAILSIYIAYIYRKTHKGLSYSQSFIFTLIIMCTVISVLMMVIGNSLARAIGIFGAFTIVRFRTVVKDTKDAAFLIYSLAAGMAVGTGNDIVAIGATILISLIILLLDKYNFGSAKKYEHVLTFILNTEQTSSDRYKELFEEQLKSFKVLNIKSLADGNQLELSFNIEFSDENQKESFIKKLENIHGISSVALLCAKNDIEY